LKTIFFLLLIIPFGSLFQIVKRASNFDLGTDYVVVDPL